MFDLALYLGGVRSGKSALAEQRVLEQAKGKVFYVATAERVTEDTAMTKRIAQHQVRRPKDWTTLEYPRNLGTYIGHELETLYFDASGNSCKPLYKPTILIDCVPLWVSNIICSLPRPDDIESAENAALYECTSLLDTMQKHEADWILVSSEVGLGGIGASPLERCYADCLGLVNQTLAKHAQHVFWVMAGRALRLETY